MSSLGTSADSSSEAQEPQGLDFRLKGSSLSHRLLLALILITLATMAIFVCIRYFITITSLEKDLATRAENIATRIANSVAPSVWDIYRKSYDRAFSQEVTNAILEAEFRDPYLKGIVVYGNFGHVFMELYKDASGELVSNKDLLEPDADLEGSYSAYVAIKNASMTTGNVRVFLSSDPSAKLIRDTLLIEIVQALVIATLFVVFLFFAIQKVLIAPLRELQLADAELKRANQRLETANKELEEFAYRSSHDLRSPLASSIGVIGLTKELIHENELSEALDCLEKVDTALNKLDRLVLDILQMTEMENMEDRGELTDLTHLVQESIQSVEHLKESKQISFEIDIESEPLKLHRIRLRNILDNLLSNAVKYSDVQEPLSRIRLSARTENDQLVLKIADNGLGIPEPYRKDIFTMFTRFHPRISRGSGLGLYLVKKSIERIGGTIHYAPLPKGSCFTLSIPIQNQGED
ncbi:HAMP domain-containing sensor histidine kinase [Pelagicoccus sp. SDUM812003]|uniref:sensor histidine kinase n=1 Tax=Pelagicoccus sp. SDUM812003 TaxID=3041267 RepID=UPI00280CAAE6|nr:HAMP domain-containing sensor histidine kinase [Pelagicoccus sp. SDUM812003]MDQ8203279.1 HAMP domain-containing sensor histidine kinase [Pelagicoccus sp. SDUM812003]